MHSGGINNTLSKLIKEAIKINNKLYKQSMEKCYISIVCERVSYIPYNRTKEQHYNPNTIEINNIKKRLAKERKSKGLKKGRHQFKKKKEL